VVSFTLQTLYSTGNGNQYPLARNLGNLQRTSVIGEGGPRVSFYGGNRTPSIYPPALTHLTEQLGIHYCTKLYVALNLFNLRRDETLSLGSTVVNKPIVPVPDDRRSTLHW
jgi:hypothetical protein